MPGGLTDLEDRWLLPFRGLTVTQVVVDFEFGLILGGDARLSIATTAELGWAARGERSDSVELHPERQDVAAGLDLFNTSVLSAVAFKSGGLRLVFDDGHLLRVRRTRRTRRGRRTGLAACSSSACLVVPWPSGSRNREAARHHWARRRCAGCPSTWRTRD